MVHIYNYFISLICDVAYPSSLEPYFRPIAVITLCKTIEWLDCLDLGTTRVAFLYSLSIHKGR